MPEHILITQCQTPWNSTFYLLERIVDFKAPLNAVLSNISSVSGLSSYEWSIVEGYVEALRPLEQGTKKLPGTRYSTIPMVISVLKSIFDHIKAVDMNDFGNAIIHHINKRWPSYESNSLYSVSTILDPRFKRCGFSTELAEETAFIQTLDELYQLHVEASELSCNQSSL